MRRGKQTESSPRADVKPGSYKVQQPNVGTLHGVTNLNFLLNCRRHGTTSNDLRQRSHVDIGLLLPIEGDRVQQFVSLLALNLGKVSLGRGLVHSFDERSPEIALRLRESQSKGKPMDTSSISIDLS